MEEIANKTFLYPTDTTFGIGCSANDVESIKRIFEIKKRAESKSLIILVDTPARLQSIVDVPELAWDIMDLSQKPVTIVYDDPKNLPKELIAEDNTIAIRLTDDLFCKKIIVKLKSPIVSTSANISGDPTPNQFEDISQAILEGVDYIFPEAKNFKPHHTASSVIKLSKDGVVKVLRE
jgi:L-threonylcarbamoyladenylate synthase